MRDEVAGLLRVWVTIVVAWALLLQAIVVGPAQAAAPADPLHALCLSSDASSPDPAGSPVHRGLCCVLCTVAALAAPVPQAPAVAPRSAFAVVAPLRPVLADVPVPRFERSEAAPRGPPAAA